MEIEDLDIVDLEIVPLGELGELVEQPHWRLRTLIATLGELGELVELPHWRFGNVTPQCFVAGSQ